MLVHYRIGYVYVLIIIMCVYFMQTRTCVMPKLTTSTANQTHITRWRCNCIRLGTTQPTHKKKKTNFNNTLCFISFQIEDAMLMFDKQTNRHRGECYTGQQSVRSGPCCSHRKCLIVFRVVPIRTSNFSARRRVPHHLFMLRSATKWMGCFAWPLVWIEC